MALTDSWLKANHAKPRKQLEEQADSDGMGVRITPHGRIIFQLRYRYDGSPKRLDLGTYPLLSLKEARTEARRLKKELEQGHDPKVVRLLEKQAILKADTIESLFKQWYEAYCQKNKKGHEDIKRSFELHVFPKIGKLPADRVTLHEWLDLLETLAATKPAIADRILTNAKQMLKWGVKRRLIPSSPLADINAKDDLQIKKVAGSRSLSHGELTKVWRAIDHSRMAPKNKLFLKLCLIYGCRNGELRQSEKNHFDFDKHVWIVPPENHKLGKATGKPLLRPIIPATEALLREAFALSTNNKYVFTNDGSSEPMGIRAPLSLPYNIMQWLRRNDSYEMAHWSVHDLRKTARTNFSTLTEPHIAEIMLGHRLPGSWQIYDHHDYLEEQALAYTAWAKRINSLVLTT